MVPELQKITVRMKNPERVKSIVSALRKGGAARLQVISDFDMTLTRFGFNGKRCPTSHNIIDNCRVISEEGRKKLKDLLHHYYPIEIDPYQTMEDKLPLMIEWWTKAHNLLSQEKILKNDIAQIVKESDVKLRDGFNIFFDQLHENKVPLFIFSAGVGDVLEEIIHQAGVFHPNINVVSNYMDFDDNGVLQGFKDPLIHIYNKNNTVLKNTEYFQQLCKRTNILLLGDSMGDLSMADGVADMENILRIGFLNDRVEERREKYIEAYDIVLEKDETLDVIQIALSDQQRREFPQISLDVFGLYSSYCTIGMEIIRACPTHLEAWQVIMTPSQLLMSKRLVRTQMEAEDCSCTLWKVLTTCLRFQAKG